MAFFYLFTLTGMVCAFSLGLPFTQAADYDYDYYDYDYSDDYDYDFKGFWVYGANDGPKIVKNNMWLDYDQDEIPEDTSGGDSPDKLRSHDKCVKNGKYKRSFCLDPPDCGKGEKLCISRIPKPHDKNSYYVKAMKCIPTWENCDKCICGKLNNNDKCKFENKGEADDDRWVYAKCDEYNDVTLKSAFRKWEN
mmetsp:Transcript_9150/g.13278  ORF Transcript_9150/g.13278 Transcript_9150/m.13278 type:complete len:193 (-) Transcript_9150:233-811(-)